MFLVCAGDAESLSLMVPALSKDGSTFLKLFTFNQF